MSKPITPSVREVEIVKAALESDILRQKNYLEELEELGIVRPSFNEWLEDSRKLLRKTNSYLSKLKAVEYSDKEKETSN